MTRAAGIVRMLMAAILLAWSSFASAQAVPMVGPHLHPCIIPSHPAHMVSVPPAVPNHPRHATEVLCGLCSCPLMAPWMAAAPVPLADPVCTTRAASVGGEVTRTGLPTTPSIPPPRRLV